MDLNALDIASMAGHIMLENGAEISRVEEVMERIASSFGADSRKFFVLSNGIFTTGKGYANVEFIPIHGSQLDKVIEVNQMSRDIEAGIYTIEEAYEKLKQIKGIPPHPVWEQLLGSALGSAAFCAIFGGGLADCALSLVSGVLLWIFVLYVSMPCFSKVTGNIVGGILVTIFSIMCYNFGIGHLDNILIGAIIPLIPGVAFTNGIRDLGAEDYIAGATRMLDALMVFLCIAVGVCITFLIDSHIEGYMIQLKGTLIDPITATWPIQILSAFVGTAAFGVLYGVPRKYYVPCAVCGTAGWIVYLAMLRYAGTSTVESALFATMTVVISAYFYAFRLGCPVIVFLICGIFPLVPGAGIFWTSYNIVSDHLTAALASGFEAVKLTFSIVFGIIIITEMRRQIFKRKKTK